MSISDMTNRLLAFNDKQCGRGATPEDIAAAERILGVSFTESYRHFLSDFGWGRFSHQELYGLGSDVPSYADLIRNTLVERSEMEPSLPSHLIPVMNDGAGNHYCLDTAIVKNGENPVVFWDHEQPKNQNPVQVATTFDSWLLDLLAELASA